MLHYYFPGFRSKALTLSYDDGQHYDRRLVELFNHYQLKATFHLVSGLLDQEPWVSGREVGELYRGHEISCHTLNHPLMNRIPRTEIMREIWTDRANLEKLAGYPVDWNERKPGIPDTRIHGLPASDERKPAAGGSRSGRSQADSGCDGAGETQYSAVRIRSILSVERRSKNYCSGQWKSSRDENGDLFFEQTGKEGGILMVRMDPSERCAKRRFFFTAKLKRLRSEKGKKEFFQFHVNYRNLYNHRKASAFHRGIPWPGCFGFFTEGHTGDPGCRKEELSSGEDGKSPQARLYMNFQGQVGNFYFQMPPDYSKNYKLILESDVLMPGDTASLSYQAVNATEEYFRDCKFQLMVKGKAYFVQGATLLRNKKFTVDWELSDSAGKKVLSGKDIPFKVKDISPGKYKLKAMLTRNDGLCVKSTVFPVEILSKMK